MGDLTAIFIIGIITLGIYRLFELFVRKNERMSIIDKIGDKIKLSDTSNLEFNLPVFQSKGYSNWSLKISLLLIGIGIGSLISFFITNFVEINGDQWRVNESIYFACIAIFGGFGLLISYLIEQKQNK